MKRFSEFLEGRCWTGYKSVPGKKPYSPGSCVKESAAAAIAAATAIAKKKSGNYDEKGFRKTPYKNSDHPNRKSNTEREAELKEDLRKWFSKTDPAGDWKRINSKGEAIGPCAREPGEPKPKCMSRAKRNSLTKKERASAVASKRKHDPNPERKGEPINVSNFGKGKISEDMENLDEKNVPTSPEKWAQAKSQAKAKFDVYPSAYANGWASKKYKAMGGGWKSVSEAKDEREYGYEGDMALNQLATLTRCAEMIKDLLKPDTDMPEWVQSKITLATDYIQTAADYMYSEMKDMKEDVSKMPTDKLQKHWDSHKDEQRPSPAFASKLKMVAKELSKRKAMKKEEVELDEADQKFIDSLNKLAKTHKIGDSVTVDSKFFGKQKGKVTKVDNQSVHVVRDGKKSAEKYPHNAVVKEASDNGGTVPTPAAGTLTATGQPKLNKTIGQTKMIPFVHEAKETKPPFDKPYTTTKAVVTDKSGAKHTPMSRARDLARKAMARNMKEQSNITPNPFTVPVIDIGKAPKKTKATMTESRQLEIVREAMKVAKKKKEVTEAGTDKFIADPELSSQITKSNP